MTTKDERKGPKLVTSEVTEFVKPKSEEELWHDECEADVIHTFRSLLKDAKERVNGRCMGVSVALVYEDGSTGSRHSKVSGFSTLLGAIEIMKVERVIEATTKVAVVRNEPTDDDE